MKPIENILVDRCTAAGLSIAVAESCTGGLIAHRITNVSGASAVFKGGVVAYANEVKMRVLGVPQDALAAFGAVSEPVALAMAAGVRDVLNADFSVAVTGVAGPGGGTAEKPVGTVYIAVSERSGACARLCQFSGTRDDIKNQTAETALKFLLELLERP
jgi:PncC family amidohydrolase